MDKPVTITVSEDDVEMILLRHYGLAHGNVSIERSTLGDTTFYVTGFPPGTVPNMLGMLPGRLLDSGPKW